MPLHHQKASSILASFLMAPYHNSNENGYYTEILYDNNRYYYCNYTDYSSYYPPAQSSVGFSCYEYLPTQSLVVYSACHDVNYSDPGSIQYAVHHSVAAPPLVDDDIDFAEYNPHPYTGGYDIAQTYGKPLSPNVEICYPRSSIDLTLPSPVLVQKQEEELPNREQPEHDLKSETQVEEEESEEEEEEELPNRVEAEEEEEEEEKGEEEEAIQWESEDGDGDGSDQETSADSVQVYEGVGENNYERVVNQIPPGYGLEAFDICENLFGYWPCLSKMKYKKCEACGNEKVVGGGDDVDEWKRTADYLFGNLDPYGGWTDQGGCSTGNPVYAYDQMQYQQPASVVYQQADQYGTQNSWFL